MAISDSPNQRELRSPRPRSVKDENSGKWWSDSQKLEAVKTHLLLGHLGLTAATLKIPEETVRRWSKTAWWHEIADDFKQQDEIMLSARLKRIVEKSLDVVEDRLDKGDFVYDQKTGQFKRKAVPMRDAHKVALDMSNKRDAILNNHGPRASEEQMVDKLEKLAEKFASLAGHRKLEMNTLEAEIVESKMVPSEPLPSEVLSGDGYGGADEALQKNERSSPNRDGEDLGSSVGWGEASGDVAGHEGGSDDNPEHNRS